MLVAQARIEASDARSSCTNSGDALGIFVAMIESACLAFSRLRLAMMMCAPLAASARQVSRPRPLLAPVTRAVRPCKLGISFVVQRLMQNLLLSPKFEGHLYDSSTSWKQPVKGKLEMQIRRCRNRDLSCRSEERRVGKECRSRWS